MISNSRKFGQIQIGLILKEVAREKEQEKKRWRVITPIKTQNSNNSRATRKMERNISDIVIPIDLLSQLFGFMYIVWAFPKSCKNARKVYSIRVLYDSMRFSIHYVGIYAEYNSRQRASVVLYSWQRMFVNMKRMCFRTHGRKERQQQQLQQHELKRI